MFKSNKVVEHLCGEGNISVNTKVNICVVVVQGCPLAVTGLTIFTQVLSVADFIKEPSRFVVALSTQLQCQFLHLAFVVQVARYISKA